MKSVGTITLILIAGSLIIGLMTRFWIGTGVFFIGAYLLYQVQRKYRQQ